jgi:hypothetical protein
MSIDDLKRLFPPKGNVIPFEPPHKLNSIDTDQETIATAPQPEYPSPAQTGDDTMSKLAIIPVPEDERLARFNASVIAPPAIVEPVRTPVIIEPAAVSTQPVEVLPPVRTPVHRSLWGTFGRGIVGLGIISTGIFIAYTSLRANAWFGHSLTPDPAAGEIYSHLSVAAEVIACLIPTANQFYWRDRRWWSALRGWGLMAVALVVVFFAAGGFALTNINAGIEARAERETPEVHTAQARIATLAASRGAECGKRGPQCKRLEGEEQVALADLASLQRAVATSADPQAAALGLPSAQLRLAQAAAMVALCLCAGLFISFGAGLVWPR